MAYHGCVLRAQSCGLEIYQQDNRMARFRPDRDNPRSRGYACRKDLNLSFHQHHEERLTHPFRRKSDGRSEQINWPQTLDEIAEKLGTPVDRHGPRTLAYMGGGARNATSKPTSAPACCAPCGPVTITTLWANSSPVPAGSGAAFWAGRTWSWARIITTRRCS